MSTGGRGFFNMGRMSKVLANRGRFPLPTHPPSKENPAECALIIFLLNSLKSLMTSFLLYLSEERQKLRLVFNSLYWHFVNENFDRLMFYGKRFMFSWLGREILGFGYSKCFPGLAHFYMPTSTFFVSWYKLKFTSATKLLFVIK